MKTSKGKRSSSDSFPPCRGECTVVLYEFDTYAPLEDTTLAQQLDEDNAEWITVIHEDWIQTIEPLLGHDQIQRELSGALERHSFRNATGCPRHCVCSRPLTRVGPEQNPPATIEVTVSFTLGTARLRATYRVTVSEATKHAGSCREEFQVEQLRPD